jgi:hypothetical protein
MFDRYISVNNRGALESFEILDLYLDIILCCYIRAQLFKIKRQGLILAYGRYRRCPLMRLVVWIKILKCRVLKIY